ncbi:MAG: hypothetical protein ACK5PI_06465, partial [Acetobacteraceae bacterium]
NGGVAGSCSTPAGGAYEYDVVAEQIFEIAAFQPPSWPRGGGTTRRRYLQTDIDFDLTRLFVSA